MNKVVAILGVIILITLGALFFCVGFFTGTTMPSMLSAKTDQTEQSTSEKITLEDIKAKISAESSDISNKVTTILSSGAQTVSDSVSQTINKVQAIKLRPFEISSDILLKEIIASHAEHDDCSLEKTAKNLQTPAKYNPDSLKGKKVVFLGYFKDDIAIQIQALLIKKGYKVHIEPSKICRGESFIFCGPFQKTENAEKLAEWLQRNKFSEARVVNVVQEPLEEKIYDAMTDDNNFPENEEKDIPEISGDQLNAAQNSAHDVPPQMMHPNAAPGMAPTPQMPHPNTAPGMAPAPQMPHPNAAPGMAPAPQMMPAPAPNFGPGNFPPH